MKRVLSLLSVCALLITIACSQPAAPNLTPKSWSIPIGGFGPSVLQDGLLVGYLDGIGEQFAAVDIAARSVIWHSEKGGAVSFTKDMAVSQGVVYIFLSGKGLQVYSKTGQILSRVPLPEGDNADGGRIGAGLVL